MAILRIWDEASQQYQDVPALVGPQGPQGPQGAQGPAGADGSPGSPGPNEVSTSTASNISGLLKGNGTTVEAAQAGTDYQAPLTAGTDYVTPTQLAGKQDEITASGLLKSDGDGNVSAAVAGTDYLPMNGGTLSGQLQASSTAMAALAVQQVRNIYFGTAEMEDGVSDLPAGVLYFQYDAGV